ncbi:MAG: carboxypeptidase M32 [Firmicutes bacterium]|nr:carboxypeptidase M32 [Bacillota bacterium]
MNNLLEYLERIDKINYVINVLRWEMDTTAPKKSFDYLIDVSTKYELEVFDLVTSKDYINLIDNVINSGEFNDLDEVEKRYITKLKDEYTKFVRVPKDFYEEYAKLKSNSLNSWVEAKDKNDYSIFKPYLTKMIDMTKKYYRYMYPNSNNLYDEMLNDYEEGVTSSTIDKLFEELKPEVIKLVKNLKSNKLKEYNKEYSNDLLINLSKYLLDYIGFDNSRGTLGIYSHGYTSKFNNNDVRITFNNKSNIFDHISTVIHEGGHGIFEQNISDILSKYGSYDIDKYALHESQSRFYENMLGRNKNFFIPIYDDIKSMLKLDMDIEEFIKYFNDAKASLIRTEADELTYCLHIIIRYEIERDLFNDKLSAEDLVEVWNKKYYDYLGVEVTSDREGILQDMHWSDGSFGYFPSYLLGSIFDGMLLNTINSKVGDIDTLLREGRIKEISEFLNQNIHEYGGTYNISEVAMRVCGTDLEVNSLINYFKNKYE